MDYNEMLFALQLRQAAIQDLERTFPEQMAGIQRTQTIRDHIDGFLMEALDEVVETAQVVRQVRKG